MPSLSLKLHLILHLAKTQSLLFRRFDGSLGGISLTEFMILYYLSEAKEEKLRRIDLATKVGLTPSAITRLLLQMEKIGLVTKEPHEYDARVSFVLLAPGGKRKFTEALEDAESLAFDLLSTEKKKQIEEYLKLFNNLSKNLQ